MGSPAVAVGEVIGHYRILERVGEGGMGVVYRAHDERLNRDVALKFLSGNSLNDTSSHKRFRKEALALAKLNHPNVAVLHDFDSKGNIDFLVIEYVHGETLSKKLMSAALSEEEILSLGMQLVDGLASAHEEGVLHGDIKPGNLRLTRDGRLKILDFGLAKLCQPASTATTESVGDLQFAGTPAYMAPEQLRGQQASISSDIYSTGAVLYEMCTRRKPFGDAPAFRLVHSILNEMPKPLRELNSAISPQLEQVILKCLDKDPRNRYHSAVELGVDLRRLSLTSTTTPTGHQPRIIKGRRIVLGTAALLLLAALLGFTYSWINRLSGSHLRPPTIQSLAVLPLQNLSGNPEQEYFADGITEELITDLAQISALRVISRTSIMTYKGSRKSLPEIASELNVDAVLEGSVERVQDRVRINAQLIQAKTDRHLWAKSYERNVSDVLSLQEEVSRAIATEIQIKLTADELRRLSQPRVVNPDAHESYLLGRYYWSKRTKEGVGKSIHYLAQATAKDPNYALAYAALSDSYHLLPDLAGSPAKDSFDKARAAALKALELDPSLAEAHAALAKVKEDYDWDWTGAENEYKQAIELNGGLGVIHAWYSNLLAETGRIPEALVQAEKAQQLDPVSSFANANLGSILYFSGQYKEALEQTWKTIDIDPTSARAHRTVGCIYAAQRLYDKAVLEFKRAIELSPGTPEYLGELGYVYAKWGHKKEADQILKRLRRSQAHREASSYSLAVVYTGIGDKPTALRLLAKGVEERAAGIVQLRVSPMFDELRPMPAFQDLLRQVALSK
ncbi:MAG TPA: protein kinase [Terriglobales bacterium]|nr:protein kinase [Terriglobales bacterium]